MVNPNRNQTRTTQAMAQASAFGAFASHFSGTGGTRRRWRGSSTEPSFSLELMGGCRGDFDFWSDHISSFEIVERCLASEISPLNVLEMWKILYEHALDISGISAKT